MLCSKLRCQKVFELNLLSVRFSYLGFDIAPQIFLRGRLIRHLLLQGSFPHLLELTEVPLLI